MSNATEAAMRVDLDEVERLEKAATPGPLDVVLVRGDSSLLAGDICVAECDPDVDEKISPDQAWNNAMCFAAARNALPALIAELRALRETVAKLPRTADGVPIVSGMKVFFWSEDRKLYVQKASSDPLPDWEQGADDCYSTREAALAAHRKGDQP